MTELLFLLLAAGGAALFYLIVMPLIGGIVSAVCWLFGYEIPHLLRQGFRVLVR